MRRGKLTDRIEIAGQPTADELRALKAEGFTTIVNMRLDGEGNQPLSPTQEGEIARATGFAYHHIPVDGANPRPEQAAALKKVLEETEGQVFVHCAGGPRAAAVALIASGFTDKDAALDAAEKAGFPITAPGQLAFIEQATSDGGL
jgi:uncharacterized protein (TIGR01244 family)